MNLERAQFEITEDHLLELVTDLMRHVRKPLMKEYQRMLFDDEDRDENPFFVIMEYLKDRSVH